MDIKKEIDDLIHYGDVIMYAGLAMAGIFCIVCYCIG